MGVLRRLEAPWVYPVATPPLQNGAVLVDETGRILAVGPGDALPCPDGAVVRRHPHAVLMPGLINAHTHLELTGFEDRLADDDFATWIQHLRGLKEECSPKQFLAAARQGLADCFAAGVTTVVDTGDSGAVIQAVAEAGGSGMIYQEVFGPHPSQCEANVAALKARVGELRRFETPRVRLGVSPHAPYTVSARLFAAVGAWARSEGLPLAVHLAESRAETDLLLNGRGPFADAWRRRGIPLPDRLGLSPVAWLAEHGGLSPGTLCIHAVQVDAADIEVLAHHGCAIAHCPGSNARHGHGEAPLRALLDAGLRVGLGTDSVASVGALDLMAEARRARALAGLTAGRALGLCTVEAARTIGLEGEVGSLNPGAWGDMVAVRVREGTSLAGLAEALVGSGPADVVATYVAGILVYGAEEGLEGH